MDRDLPEGEETREYPYLFFGQGLGMSRKCLEGYFWFERAPTPEEQPKIAETLPPPVQLGSRFEGALMHWGSDDMFPERVKAVYGPDFATMPREDALSALDRASQEGSPNEPNECDWILFCEAFEAATHAIHAICPLRVVLKPDDRRGPTLGAWHRWSVAQAASVVAVAPPTPVTRAWCYFAANLLRDTLRKEQIEVIDASARRAWLGWLETVAPRAADLVVDGNASLAGGSPISSLASELLDAIGALVGSFPKAEARMLRDELHVDARRLLEEREAWKQGTAILKNGTAQEIAEAIESRLLSVARAMAALHRRPPRLDDVLPSSPTLTMIRTGATTDIAAALADERLTVRDLRTCAMSWPERTEALLTVLVSAVPLPTANAKKARAEFLANVNSLAVLLQQKGDFDAAWEVVEPYVSHARENPYLCHTAACSLAKRGHLDEALDQIQIAAECGYQHMDKIRTDTDLEALFAHPRFSALVGNH